MARFDVPFFGVTVVIVERRKPKDWEPPRAPTSIPKDVQKKIDLAAEKLQDNSASLNAILKSK
jgi:hypothetical protein